MEQEKNFTVGRYTVGAGLYWLEGWCVHCSVGVYDGDEEIDEFVVVQRAFVNLQEALAFYNNPGVTEAQIDAAKAKYEEPPAP